MKGQRAKGRGHHKGRRLSRLVGFVLVAMALAGGVARAETIDRVLAVAGGQVILLSDVTVALDLGLVSDDGAADRVGAALAKLISRNLVLVEATRYAPPEPADADVEKEMASLRARFPSLAAFDAVFERSGLTDQRLRLILRENLRIRAYIAQRFTGAEDESRRSMLIDEWMAGLRQRSDVIDLYATAREQK
jgi:hypothetical protein